MIINRGRWQVGCTAGQIVFGALQFCGGLLLWGFRGSGEAGQVVLLSSGKKIIIYNNRDNRFNIISGGIGVP